MPSFSGVKSANLDRPVQNPTAGMCEASRRRFGGTRMVNQVMYREQDSLERKIPSTASFPLKTMFLHRSTTLPLTAVTTEEFS